MTGYFYLDFSLELQEKPENLLEVYVKARIEEILHTIFGEIGGHTTVDLLTFDRYSRGIIRIPAQFYVKLRAALTLAPTFQEIPCTFKVHSASPVLLGLSTTFYNHLKETV